MNERQIEKALADDKAAATLRLWIKQATRQADVMAEWAETAAVPFENRKIFQDDVVAVFRRLAAKGLAAAVTRGDGVYWLATIPEPKPERLLF